MANISNFTPGVNISGAVSFANKMLVNGLVQIDPAISAITIPALFSSATDGDILVSGSMVSVNETNGYVSVVLPVAGNKGSDVEYILASEVQGYNLLSDSADNTIIYYYYKPNEKVILTKLLPGMRLQLKSATALAVGEKATVNYSANEYTIKKAVADDTALFLVEKGCDANGVAKVVVISKEIIA